MLITALVFRPQVEKARQALNHELEELSERLDEAGGATSTQVTTTLLFRTRGQSGSQGCITLTHSIVFRENTIFFLSKVLKSHGT